MKRFHVHVAVADLDGSKAFYSRLFGAEPAVVKHDYAKWMIEDPRINFYSNLPGVPDNQIPVGAAVEVMFEEVAPGQLIHEWRVA